jgi:hypothetical protein
VTAVRSTTLKSCGALVTLVAVAVLGAGPGGGPGASNPTAGGQPYGPRAPELARLDVARARAVHTRATAACPVTTNGGDTANDPYQLALTGTLSGTLQITSTPAGPINLPNIAGTFCGLLELPNETATVQPANLAINPVQVGLGRAVVPATVIATSISTGSVAITPASNGGLEVTLSVPAAAQTGLLGVSCILPTALDLSTAVPGGSPLVGPLRTGAQATLVQTGFTVGDAESTGATGTCPSYLAAQVDTLLALPNDHTATTVTISLTLPIP